MWLAWPAMTSGGQNPQRNAVSVITKVNVLVAS
jgi:hypothetical protein